MPLTALRCPNCSALLEAGAITFCSYCGARLVATEPAATNELRVASVYLDDAGENKIPVIQAVNQHLRIGLAVSRDLVNTAPCVLAKDIAEPLAQTLVVALRALKATVRITDVHVQS